jgi:hypothetical protein
MSVKPPRLTVGKSARVRFSLSERARVKLTVARRVSGHKKGRQCGTGRHAPKHGNACATYKLVRSKTTQGKHGVNTVIVKGGGKLGVGVYRLTLTATDPAGNRSNAASKPLRVVARTPTHHRRAPHTR